jgi:hypothetical protein
VVSLRLVVCVALLAACEGPPDYSWGHTEGSLAEFFDDPEAGCTCRLYLSPDEWQVQYACYPDGLDYDLTFYSILPASPNQRGRSFTDVQLGRTDWESSGFGVGAAELAFSSEDFGHPGLDEGTQVSKYREVFVWALDVQAQRICSVVEPSQCMELPAGRAEDLRFTCSVAYE